MEFSKDTLCPLWSVPYYFEYTLSTTKVVVPVQGLRLDVLGVIIIPDVLLPELLAITPDALGDSDSL